MEVLTITKQNFQQEVLASQEPVLVDFWASWCGPCRMLAPIIEEIAQEASGFRVGKINVDEEPELAGQYEVSSIPTLIVFRDGKAARRSVGVLAKDAVRSLLD
ncbi:MAG: thioredoxin [Candidatus Merdivicinus sp.]|jgi:thioredoxin 1